MGRTAWLVGLVLLSGGCGSDDADTTERPGGESATGATSSGGSSAGGSEPGGSGGTTTGGTASGGSGTGGTPTGVCDECTLYTNCCSCLALGPAADPPYCDPNIACLIDQCSALGITDTDLRCLNGTCALAVNCDTSQVLCRMAEPECPAGEVPSVENECYGPCVAAAMCRP